MYLCSVYLRYITVLTIVVIRWHRGFLNQQTGRLVSISHDTVATPQDWSDGHVLDSAVGNDIRCFHGWKWKYCRYRSKSEIEKLRHCQLFYLPINYSIMSMTMVPVRYGMVWLPYLLLVSMQLLHKKLL